ncbi:anti-sigma factor [Streptomyces sp. CC228A]|uniref:anti-sigma factor family protein n=1 Tax=Streptomyces sp. CC228A TaxID=2898186 RepID=UPI001F2015B1|nr:zf-HC2 domain-containing protein [Streptomyces sp. CC228A]
MKTLLCRRTPGIWSQCRERLLHLRLRRSVGPYADGELTGAARARVAEHIARCWVCSGTLETLRLVKSSLRRGPQRAPASSPPPASTATRTGWPAIPPRRRHPWAAAPAHRAGGGRSQAAHRSPDPLPPYPL